MSVNLSSIVKSYQAPFLKEFSKAPTSTDITKHIIYNHIINYQESFSIDGIEKLSILTRRSRVKFSSTVGDHIQVRLKGALSTTSPSPPSISLAAVKDTVLGVNSLKYEGLGHTNIESLSIDICIPTNYTKKINFQTTCSPIEVQELWGEELNLTTISSNVFIQQLKVNRGVINTISGAIKIMKSAGHLSLETVTGDISVALASNSVLNIKTVTGNTKVDIDSSVKSSLCHKTVTGKLTNGFGFDPANSKEIPAAQLDLASITGDFNITYNTNHH